MGDGPLVLYGQYRHLNVWNIILMFLAKTGHLSYTSVLLPTVYDRMDAAATINFSVQSGAATI